MSGRRADKADSVVTVGSITVSSPAVSRMARVNSYQEQSPDAVRCMSPVVFRSTAWRMAVARATVKVGDRR